ncbi:MAG: hypothetical protein D6702_11075 [Planctomycetota bacterium]|nr:MAG: hypothetical protein D6702_11075 [Planctomycetota bacterium]
MRPSPAVLLGLLLLAPAALAQGPGDLEGLRQRFLEGTGRSQFHPAGGSSRSTYDGQAVYHSNELLICSDCHVMHASMQHNYAGTTDPVMGISSFPFEPTPNPNLLKYNKLDLCLSCHDNVAGVPDVMGADVNGLTQRAGGHFEAPESNPATGHNLGYNVGPSTGFDICMRCHFGGTFATAQVTCVDCHTPHGYGNARNLQWASDPGAEPIFGLFVNPAASGMARYEAANVGYGTLDNNTLREVTSICIDCHHTFSGSYYVDPNGNGIHERHPAYNSEYNSTNTIAQGAAKGSTDPAHWNAGTGAGFDVPRVRFIVQGADTFAGTQVVDANTNGVFCLSCHYVHGSDNAFGLVWSNAQYGAGPSACDQCHNKSGL